MRLTRAERRTLRALASDLDSHGLAERLSPPRWWERPGFVAGVASFGSFGACAVFAEVALDLYPDMTRSAPCPSAIDHAPGRQPSSAADHLEDN